MSKPRFDDFETGSDEVIDATPESTSTAHLTSKLERRRRIEELDEERRLRKELSEY